VLPDTWWLIPITLATQKTEIRRISMKRDPINSSRDPISRKPITKKELTEWLKVRPLV
jgi:hypothetical protein